MSAPTCPSCGTLVQPNWDWCYKCGFDPDDKRPATAPAAGTMPNPAPTYAPPSYPPYAGPPKNGGANLALIIGGIVFIALLGVGAFFFVGKAKSPTTTVPASNDAAAGPTTTLDAWQSFSPAGAGFTVDLPDKPIPRDEPLRAGGVMHFYMSATATNEAATNVTGIAYVDLGPGDPHDFTTAASSFAGGYGSTPTDQVPVDYAGNKGVDFTLATSNAEGMRARIRLLNIGPRFYFMAVFRPPGKTTDQEADFIRLTNSLKIG